MPGRSLILPPPPTRADNPFGDESKRNFAPVNDLEKWIDRGEKVSGRGSYSRFPTLWKREVFRQIDGRLRSEAERDRKVCEAAFDIERRGYCHSTHISHGATLLYIAGGLESFTIPRHIRSISKLCANPNSDLRELTMTSKLSSDYYDPVLTPSISPMEMLSLMPKLKKIKFAGKPYAIEKLPYSDEKGPMIRLTNLLGTDFTFYRTKRQNSYDPAVFVQIDKTGGGVPFRPGKFSRTMTFDYTWIMGDPDNLTQDGKCLKEIFTRSPRKDHYKKSGAFHTPDYGDFVMSEFVKDTIKFTKRAVLFGQADFVVFTDFFHVSDYGHLHQVLIDLVDPDSAAFKSQDWRMCFRIFRSVALQTGKFDPALCETWPKDNSARILRPDTLYTKITDYLFFQEWDDYGWQPLGRTAPAEVSAQLTNREALFQESSGRAKYEYANLKEFLRNNIRRPHVQKLY